MTADRQSHAARRLIALTLILATLGGAMATVAQPLPRTAESADSSHIVMASTTSTEQSGLFTHVLPRFTAKTGIQVRVVALGTGQAIAVAARGDADLLLVHDKVAEEKFVADGFGFARRDVMYNDFVVVGPASDPARLSGVRDVVRALGQIAQGRHPFLSRGDRSGTHAAELRYWKDAGIDPKASAGAWYRETGSGMGPTLNIAAAMNAHALTDRGTWLNFRNRGELKVLVEGDERLFNQYGVIVVNPARHPHVKLKQAQAFADWVVSSEGQQAIADYRIGGEALFFPNAKR
jgi:tungstate transport system substrate-binding protein